MAHDIPIWIPFRPSSSSSSSLSPSSPPSSSRFTLRFYTQTVLGPLNRHKFEFWIISGGVNFLFYVAIASSAADAVVDFISILIRRLVKVCFFVPLLSMLPSVLCKIIVYIAKLKREIMLSIWQHGFTLTLFH